jgi:hypothetical protein
MSNTAQMAKIKKFTSPSVKKIIGGKDPLRLLEEFILRLGFEPSSCEKEREPENIRWLIKIEGSKDLEVLLENIKRPNETTVYMGLSVFNVPLRGATDILVAALEIADGLVGIKLSLVGSSLILSASLAASGLSADELEYHYRLIIAQQDWFRDALKEELGF